MSENSEFDAGTSKVVLASVVPDAANIITLPPSSTIRSVL
jgi:hypothetical protein